MKKKTLKLTLNRETLRNLDPKELGNALGGAINVTSLVSLGKDTLGKVAGQAKGPTAIDCSITCLAPDQTSFDCL